MEYKIYNCSLQLSKPPYFLEEMKDDINSFEKYWEDKNSPIWRYIGSVSSLGIARKMVEYNKMYYSENGIIYSLECDPSDEFFCEFVKIEYDNNVEYYDDYCNHNNGKIFERRFI
jgi:hypothetical protein